MDETPPSHDWLLPPDAPEEAAAPRRSLSGRAKAVGVVATAVVVGFVGVLAVQGSSASPAASSTPAGRSGPGPGGFGGFGGPPGGGGFVPRGLQGTVASVSSSSITVTTAGGASTVRLTSATEVVVNGARGSLSDVRKGAIVFVHTEGTGSARYAERVFVGPPGAGPGAPGSGPPPGTGTTGHT